MQTVPKSNRKTVFKAYCNNKTLLVGSESSATSSRGLDVLVRDIRNSDSDSSETDSKQFVTTNRKPRPGRRLVTLKLRRVPVTKKKSLINLKRNFGVVSEHSFFSKKQLKTIRQSPGAIPASNECSIVRQVSQRKAKAVSFESARDSGLVEVPHPAASNKRPPVVTAPVKAIAERQQGERKQPEARRQTPPCQRFHRDRYRSPSTSNRDDLSTDTGSVEPDDHSLHHHHHHHSHPHQSTRRSPHRVPGREHIGLPQRARQGSCSAEAAPVRHEDATERHHRPDVPPPRRTASPIHQPNRPDKAKIQKAMAQRSNHKFNVDPRDMRRSAGEGGMAAYRDTSSSAPSRSSGGESRVFPFKATPSGNFKVNSNQVIFESNKVSVLVADPVITKVNVKAELDTIKLQGVGFGSSQQRNCSLENPRLDALTMLGREEYIYYNDCMTDECHDSDGRADNEPELYLNRKGFSKSTPIDWKKLNLPAKSDLYGQLQNRIHNYIKPDCVVQIGNEEYCCHAIVLQCYSKYFDNLDLVGNKNKVQLPEDHVSRRAYAIVYDWMIMPDSESSRLLRRDNILEIFRAAQYLQITELQQQCWAFLDNDEMFAEDTAFLMYLQAKKTGHTDVMQIMVPRIMKFFLCLVSSRDYIELNIDELCMILRSNYISVHTEMEVFMAAVRWLMFDWPARQQYVEEVMSCIRFGHISPWTLVDIRRNPRNPPFLEVTNSKEVHTMIDDGLAFAIVKYWYANSPKDYTHWISILGITEPIGRNWIKPPIHYVTYDEFLVDLNYYRRVYLSDQKRAKNGKAATGQYYELPALPPKEHTFPHEVGVPFGPPPLNEVPPPDLANILEQRRVRVSNTRHF